MGIAFGVLGTTVGWAGQGRPGSLYVQKRLQLFHHPLCVDLLSRRLTLACPEFIRFQHGPVLAKISENLLLDSAIHPDTVNQITVSNSFVPFHSYVGHGVHNKLGTTRSQWGFMILWIMIL